MQEGGGKPGGFCRGYEIFWAYMDGPSHSLSRYKVNSSKNNKKSKCLRYFDPESRVFMRLLVKLKVYHFLIKI